MASTSSYEESSRKHLRSASDEEMPEGSLSGDQGQMRQDEIKLGQPEILTRAAALPSMNDLAEEVAQPLIEALEEVPVEQVGGKKKMDVVMAFLKNKKYMGIVLAVVLLIVALGGGGYMYKRRQAAAVGGGPAAVSEGGLLGSIKQKVMSSIGRGE